MRHAPHPGIGFALLLAAATRIGAAPELLPQAPDVHDPVFAMLVAYVRANRLGPVSRESIAETLVERRQESRLPWRLAREFARVSDGQDGRATVTLRFDRPVDVPIPYQILWYHPGRIRASASCRFREWRLAELPIDTRPPGQRTPWPPLAEVRLFALDEGELLLDIDGWLDALLGEALDDTFVTCLAVGRYRGREYGFAVGRNRAGKPRIGAFDLSADAVVFPLPSDLRAANRAIRREYERQLATAR